jgi:mannitol/fructose-specific phosphotransferase system IIA component (Ntr-type)
VRYWIGRPGLASGDPHLDILLRREEGEYCVSVGMLLQCFREAMPHADPRRVSVDFILVCLASGGAAWLPVHVCFADCVGYTRRAAVLYGGQRLPAKGPRL